MGSSARFTKLALKDSGVFFKGESRVGLGSPLIKMLWWGFGTEKWEAGSTTGRSWSLEAGTL